MTNNRTIRLFKVAKELNVSTSMLVEHLRSNGHSVEDSPNTKLSGDQFNLLLMEFGSDKLIKEQAEQLSEKKREELKTVTGKPEEPAKPESEEPEKDPLSAEQLRDRITPSSRPIIRKKPEPAPGPPVAEEPPVKEESKTKQPPEEQPAEEPVAKDSGPALKVVGKIDLDSLKRGAKKEEEAEKSPLTAEQLRSKINTGLTKSIRLFKVAKELNVSTSMLVEHLGSNGHSVEDSPNTKLSGDQFNLLLMEFGSEKLIQEQDEQFSEKEVPNENNSLQALKIVGAIELDALRKPSAISAINNAPTKKGKRKRRSLSILQSHDFGTIIEFALEKQLLHLDCSRKIWEEIPNSLNKLKQLESLSLRGCQLSEFPKPILELVNLRSLDLGQNKIDTIPSEVKRLKNLRQLKIDQNKIFDLPDEICYLTQLQLLVVNSNYLHMIPQEIGNLKLLKTLDFGNNQLSFIPKSIEKLKQLEKLFLYENKISKLPLELFKLSKLKVLALDSNQLKVIPEEIEQLQKLEQLDIAFNHIKKLPLGFENLKQLQTNDREHEEDRGLNLEGNSFEIPEEVYSQEPEEIIQYVIDLQSGTKKLREAKVILVGGGEVGKTSIVNRLTTDSFNDNEPQTNGIEINDWPITYNKKKILLHLWDFGGQELMHATHKFFMTRRSLYLLVINPRSEDSFVREKIWYWLRLIKSFAEDAPIIIVNNKYDEHKTDIDIDEFRDDANIVGYINTSAANGSGIEDLKKIIKQNINKLPHIDDRVPYFYLEIKNKLLEKKDDYLHYTIFKKECEKIHPEINETSLKTMVNLFHDLGLLLNFQEFSSRASLYFTHVLKPTWVTQGVYSIVTSELLKKNNGILKEHQVRSILDEEKYPTPIEQNFIMEMMEYFELCYRIPEEKDTYFVPGVFPTKPPQDFNWNSNVEGILRFQIGFKFLPQSVISRFIVKVHGYIIEGQFWRNGVIINKSDCKALIKVIPGVNIIQFEITGNEKKREVLAVLRDHILTIAEKIKGTNPVEKIPLDHNGIISLDYEELLYKESKGQEYILVREIDDKVSIKKILDGVIPDQEREKELIEISDIRFRQERLESGLRRVLFIGNIPDGSDTRGFFEESKEITRAIKGSKELELIQEWNPSLMDFQDFLLTHNPYIVHLAGHGDHAGRFIFERGEKEHHYVKPEKWANLFEESPKTKCVVINACFSNERVEPLLNYIDYVIGMKDELDEKIATSFSIGFYRALNEGKSIEEAYRAGIKRPGLEGLNKESLPILRRR